MQKLRRSGREYETRVVKNDEEGWIGVELIRTDTGSPHVAARVIYWDAMGGFTVETTSGLVPLEVIEKAIEEAKIVESSPVS